VEHHGYKGIILAGGSGSRLGPLTRCLSKQLLAVYDKPMIFYPLSTLMLSGVREILIISTPRDLPLFQQLLGDGARLGLSFSYAEQPQPEGIAQALRIGRDFIGADPVALILGDNLFFGHGLGLSLVGAARDNPGGTIFLYRVRDPSRYGVATLDAEGAVTEIVEKPARPRSSYAVSGLYFYDNRVLDIADGLRPSARGELEITDVNRAYLEQGDLRGVVLGRGTAWLDTGTSEALHQAANFVEAVQSRQGQMISCVEEVAYRIGCIDLEQLQVLAAEQGQSAYGDYLRELAEAEAGP
jgi:glucose-1-phosphate thymidylyltransferase